MNYMSEYRKNSLFFEDGFPDHVSYESLNVVMNFSRMTNAGDDECRPENDPEDS